MDYDNEYLGVENSQHPANQEEFDPIEERGLTIREALETGFEDKILKAIGRKELLLSKIQNELEWAVDVLSQTENTLVKNRLKKILKTLE